MLGAESRTLHQILEAKMECEAETNAPCGTITDQALLHLTQFKKLRFLNLPVPQPATPTVASAPQLHVSQTGP